MKSLHTFHAVGVLAAMAVAWVVLESVQPAVNAATQVASPGAENAQHAPPHIGTDPGAAAYAKHCAICHGDQREGILPAFPPLMGIQRRMSNDKIVALVHTGKGRMPGLSQA